MKCSDPSCNGVLWPCELAIVTDNKEFLFKCLTCIKCGLVHGDDGKPICMTFETNGVKEVYHIVRDGDKYILK